MATFPLPSIYISRVGTSYTPGLGPVIHFIYVLVDLVTKHSMPSIFILTLVRSCSKFIPSKLTSSPPCTYPYYGLIDVNRGVFVEVYIRGLRVFTKIPSI